MKRFFFCFFVLIVFLICPDVQEAKAYSISVKNDGLYAKTIPPYISQNIPFMFKKQVKKSLQYYHKYKNADDYTYAKKIPEKYRDFIEVAKQIKEKDRIIIHQPFYIYQISEKELYYTYFFVAETNEKKLCIFGVEVSTDDGSTVFSYDKMMNRYFPLNEINWEETVFYRLDETVYGEDSEKIKVLRESTDIGISINESSDKKAEKNFYQQDYKEKKTKIFSYLKMIKEGNVAKKSNQQMKLDLKDDYQESTEDSLKQKDSYLWIFVSVIAIVLICATIILISLRKRKRIREINDSKKGAGGV